MSFADHMHAIEQQALQHEHRMLDATIAVLELWAAKAQIHMRTHAEWTNRTGQARWGEAAAQFMAQAEQRPGTDAAPGPEGRGLAWVAIHPRELRDGGAIALITDAPYGIYLETARGAAYAIIMPTVAQLGPQLIADLREIWK